jgi:hypothetical protein
VVASSGWNQDGWDEIPNGSVLVVGRDLDKTVITAC